MKSFYKNVNEEMFYKSKLQASTFSPKTAIKSTFFNDREYGNSKIKVRNRLFHYHLFKFNDYLPKFVAYTSTFQKKYYSQQ